MLFVLILMAVFFAPSLRHPSQEILGHQDADAYKHVWGQWWVVDNLTNHHRFPVMSDRMNFPDGGSFWCLDFFNAILTLPLRTFLKPIAAFNTIVLFNVFLAALAMLLLVRDLGVGMRGALTSAVIYAFSPYMLSFPIASGVAETQVIFFIPLYALVFRKAYRGSFAAALLSGLLIVLAGFACWSYGIYLGLYTFGIVIGIAALAWRSARKKSAPLFPVDRAMLKRALAFMAVAGLSAVPLFLLVRSAVHGDEVVYARPMSLFPTGPAPWNEPALTSFAWIDYFLPGPYGLRTDEFVDKLLYVSYAGYLALTLAFIGFLKNWKRSWPYAVGACAFFLFSLGPLIHSGHARTGLAMYNPVYIAMYYAFPLFNVTIHSVDRFAIMVMFFLSVGAGFGVQWILDAYGNKAAKFTFALPVLIVMEVAILSPAPWPIPTSPKPNITAAQYLKDIPGDFAVLDFPDLKAGTGLFPGEIFYWQTIHNRPIPYSLEGMSRTVRGNSFYRYIHGILADEAIAPGDPVEGVRKLAEAGFAYLVFRPGMIPQDRLGDIERIISANFDKDREMDEFVVYKFRDAKPISKNWWR